MLKIYHVSQDSNTGWDTYSDFVIIAASVEEARNANPLNGAPMTETDWKCSYSSWCASLELVTVEYLGIAREGSKADLVCTSFHAG